MQANTKIFVISAAVVVFLFGAWFLPLHEKALAIGGLLIFVLK